MESDPLDFTQMWKLNVRYICALSAITFAKIDSCLSDMYNVQSRLPHCWLQRLNLMVFEIAFECKSPKARVLLECVELLRRRKKKK